MLNASRALNVIKVLSAQPWANTPKILVNVVRALVRSRLSYGLEAMPHLSKTGPCRSAWCTERPGSSRSAATSSSSVVSMFLDARLSTTPLSAVDSTVDEITATFRKPSRLQSYSSICDLVCDLVRSAGLDGVEVATRPMHPYPP